jgi:hypothetical protein
VFESYWSVPWSITDAMSASVIAVLALLFVVVFASRFDKAIVLPLFIGLVARLALATANRFSGIAPDSTADAATFERVAWVWAQSGCTGMAQHFDPTASYVISWVYGQLYACVDRVPLAVHYINVFLGVLIIYFVAKLADRLWGREVGIRAAWIAALFPALIIYSSVTLREPFFALGILVGVYWLVCWIQDKKLVFFVAAMLAFAIATVFHGGGVFAIVGTLLFVALRGLRWLLKPTRIVSGSSFLAGGIALGALIMAFVALPEIRVNKLGDVTEIGVDTVEEMVAGAGEAMRGGSHYPAFLVGGTGVTLLWQTPVRMIYLQFGPFPWDVRAARHLLGFLDGLFYLLIAFLLWRFRKFWWGRPEFTLILLIVLSLLLVYGWGVSNFGTGFRHRAKFAALLIAMGAGVLGGKAWNRRRAGVGIHAERAGILSAAPRLGGRNVGRN